MLLKAVFSVLHAARQTHDSLDLSGGGHLGLSQLTFGFEICWPGEGELLK